MTLMEEPILSEASICNVAEIIHHEKNSNQVKRRLQEQGGSGLTILQKAIQHLTQRTVKFIRWLKNQLATNCSGPKRWRVSPSVLSNTLVLSDDFVTLSGSFSQSPDMGHRS